MQTKGQTKDDKNVLEEATQHLEWTYFSHFQRSGPLNLASTIVSQILSAVMDLSRHAANVHVDHHCTISNHKQMQVSMRNREWERENITKVSAVKGEKRTQMYTFVSLSMFNYLPLDAMGKNRNRTSIFPYDTKNGL